MSSCATCGHDAEAIKSSMETRISEQATRIREQKIMLEQAVAKATELDAKVKDYATREEAIGLREAESTAGWKFDDRGRKLARWAYDDATEAVAAEEKPSFAEWLKGEGALADAVLSSYRASTGASAMPPKAGQAPGAPKAPAPTPPQNAGTNPPVRRTLDQINAEAKAVMASGIPVAEKQAKLAELKTMRAQAATSPTGV